MDSLIVSAHFDVRVSPIKESRLIKKQIPVTIMKLAWFEKHPTSFPDSFVAAFRRDTLRHFREHPESRVAQIECGRLYLGNGAH